MPRGDIPKPVEHLAARMDKLERSTTAFDGARVNEDDWTKLCACGEPHYLHGPSGWVVVNDARGMGGVISPNQMDQVLTLAADYFRVEDGQDSVFGLVNGDDKERIIEMLLEAVD